MKLFHKWKKTQQYWFVLILCLFIIMNNQSRYLGNSKGCLFFPCTCSWSRKKFSYFDSELEVCPMGTALGALGVLPRNGLVWVVESNSEYFPVGSHPGSHCHQIYLELEGLLASIWISLRSTVSVLTAVFTCLLGLSSANWPRRCKHHTDQRSSSETPVSWGET